MILAVPGLVILLPLQAHELEVAEEELARPSLPCMATSISAAFQGSLKDFAGFH